MSRIRKSPKSARATSSVMVRLDDASKAVLKEAALLRRISVSDYVRTVTIAQARHEVESAREQIIALTPAEQRAFWQALHEPTALTPAQRELGKIMRGES